MDLSSITEAASSAALLAWIGLATGFVGWYAKTRAANKVRVRPATFSRTVLEDSGTPGINLVAQEISIALFNNLQVDVGIHEVLIYMKRAGQKPRSYIAPTKGSAPEGIKAQHSTVITLNARSLAGYWELAIEQTPSKEAAWYRIVVRLGNGDDVKTLWAKLDEPTLREAYDPGASGAGSDW